MGYFLLFIVLVVLLYGVVFFIFSRMIEQKEGEMLRIYLKKMSKIPALIEVMRPYMAKKESFDMIILVHTESMVEASDSLYDVLERNARLQKEFIFLMKLSVLVPELQKHEYFIYIRDFILQYEKKMHDGFSSTNIAIEKWNTFVRVKNMTGIGWFFPGSERPKIIG